jgi:hypothetical protein
VITFWPTVSGLVAVIDQTPPETTPVPMFVLPSNRLTVSPSVPVPVMTGSATLVMPSLLEMPLSLAVARASAIGATGANRTFQTPVKVSAVFGPWVLWTD